MKLLLSFVTAALICVMVTACHDGDDVAPSPSISVRSNPLQPKVDSLGYYHNYLLDAVFTYLKENSVTQTAELTLDIEYDSLDATPWATSVEVPQEIVDSLDAWYDAWYANETGSLNRPLEWALTIFEDLDTSHFIPATEVAIVEDILDLFQSTPASAAAWKNSMEDIQDDYENISWNAGEGELAGGLISIGLASFSYWTSPGAPDVGGDIQPIVQLDAVGYLLGWGYQFIEDCIRNPPPGLCDWCECPGGGDRILGGLFAAGGASSGGKKWWKF